MLSRPITRRGVLRGLLAVTSAASVGLASGCGIFGSDGTQAPSVPNPLEGFLRDTVALADLYDDTLSQVPALAPVITGLRDAHRAHAAALAEALGNPVPHASASAAPSRSPRRDRAAAVAALVAAETKGRDAAIDACRATSARFAPLVGSIAAARACHLVVLS